MIDTILIIVELFCLHLPLIIGAYISMSLMKIPNLGIEAAYVCGALTASRAVMLSLPLPGALNFLIITFIALGAGALVGYATSLLTNFAKVPSLLANILIIGFFHGINQLLSRPSNYISLTSAKNTLTLLPSLGYHPELSMLLLSAVLLVIGSAFLLKTQLGHCFTVYGNNPNFFRFYGISTPYIYSIGLIMSNALAGYAGFLSAQSSNFADTLMGVGKPLLCITALILGKVFLSYWSLTRTILIPALGLLLYFIIQQLLLQVGFNLKYFTMVQAILVACIVVIAYRNKAQNAVDQLGV